MSKVEGHVLFRDEILILFIAMRLDVHQPVVRRRARWVEHRQVQLKDCTPAVWLGHRVEIRPPGTLVSGHRRLAVRVHFALIRSDPSLQECFQREN